MLQGATISDRIAPSNITTIEDGTNRQKAIAMPDSG